MVSREIVYGNNGEPIGIQEIGDVQGTPAYYPIRGAEGIPFSPNPQHTNISGGSESSDGPVGFNPSV